METQLRVTKRDRLILEHIGRFNLTTSDILHGSFFENNKLDAVKSNLRRLGPKRHNLIAAGRFPNSRRRYYCLTKDGAALIGKPFSDKDFGWRKIADSYAWLYFICQQPEKVTRSKCHPRELTKFYSGDKFKLPRIDFYIAESRLKDAENPCVSLGFTFIDLDSKLRRIVDRCVNHLRNFIQRGWFADVMKAGRFELTVLTGTESKKRDIELVLDAKIRQKLRGDILKFGLYSPIRPSMTTAAVVIPGLNELTPPRRKKAFRDSAK